MRMRAAALLLLSVWLAPPVVEAGLFGEKKKLPKPIKSIHIRPWDAKRFANPTKLAAKYSPTWGNPRPLDGQPVRSHVGHYME